MERIQEAIEKARRERGVFPLNQPMQTLSPANILHNPPRTPPSTKDTNWSGANVEYVHTRQIRLDTELLKARKIVGGMAHDPMSDAYRQLRGQILQKMRDNNWQTLAITSPVSGNGKTLTAINLAISLSQEVNQTVLLADFNLRNPGVAQVLGIEDIEYGITDYLDAQVPLENILINPEYSRLVILPGNKQLNYSSEMLSSPKMRALNQELRNRYVDRIILFDLPPLLVHDDALTFIPQVDATLLVIEDGGTTKPQLERCIKLLDKHPIAGTVLNKMR